MAHQLPIRGGHAGTLALDERALQIARWPLPERVRRRIATRPFGREAASLAAIRERIAHVREMCERVDRFVSPSAFLRDRFVEWGLPASRIVVADNGFAAPHTPVPREPRGGDGRLRVVYLGTWIPSKGVHLLVEAFGGIAPDRAVLDVHGYAVPYDGFDDYEGHLRRLAAGAPHVHFRGRYGPADVPRLLARADVMVVPSIWYENSPLTLHEAFLAGVPVIAAAHGGMQEFVRDGANGLTFRPGAAGRSARCSSASSRSRTSWPVCRPNRAKLSACRRMRANSKRSTPKSDPAESANSCSSPFPASAAATMIRLSGVLMEMTVRPKAGSNGNATEGRRQEAESNRQLYVPWDRGAGQRDSALPLASPTNSIDILRVPNNGPV